MGYDTDLGTNNRLRSRLRDILGPHIDFAHALKAIEEAIHEEAARRHPAGAPVGDSGHTLALGMYQAAEVIRAARLNAMEAAASSGAPRRLLPGVAPVTSGSAGVPAADMPARPPAPYHGSAPYDHPCAPAGTMSTDLRMGQAPGRSRCAPTSGRPHLWKDLLYP